MSLDNVTGLENFAGQPFSPRPGSWPEWDADPDPAQFCRDMAAMARAGRWLWINALHGERKPDLPDLDLLCDFIPGCDTELHMAIDMAAFELIGEDIKGKFAEAAK